MVVVGGTILTVILVGHVGLVVAKPALSNLSLIGSNGNNDVVETDLDRERCMNGKWLQTEKALPGECKCNKGWRWAGPSDPVNWYYKKCSQYMCESTTQCNDVFPGSTCDVVGWNCNCGWQHASHFLYGESRPKAKPLAKCMGKMYYISDYVCSHTVSLMMWMWKPILCCMCLAVFFGEKQVRCECHDPKRFKLTRSLRKLFQAIVQHPVPNPTCPGTCVTRVQWDPGQDWSYEYSWSIYIFDLGLWAYAFLLVLFVTGFVAGSILLIALVMLAMILAAFFALIMCICGGEGGGDIGGPDACNCHELCGAGGDCPCCDGCFNAFPAPGYSSATTDFFLWGPQPAGSSCDDCTCRRDDCCPRFWLCRPLAWVLVRFPERPSNMWGGWIGRMMGTHHFTREERRYRGGKWWIDMLSFRSATDLHSDQNWRERVQQFVFSDPDPAPEQQQMNPRIGQGGGQRPRRQNGSTNVSKQRRDPWGPFTVEHDSCQPSTFEDYKTGTCWLCCRESRPMFHMWVQCGHIFCADCSDAMKERSMPCPLCRKVSTMIVEGPGPLHASSDL